MVTKLTHDMKKLLDFELNHGNEVVNIGAGEGYGFIELRLPFHTSDPGFGAALSETIHRWEWGSQHFEEKYEGFRSSIFPYDAVVIRKRER